MLEFTLYFGPSILISSFITTKICDKYSLFDHISNKSSKYFIPLSIILTLFFLPIALLSYLNLTENISNIFMGMFMGICTTLLSRVKYIYQD